MSKVCLKERKNRSIKGIYIKARAEEEDQQKGRGGGYNKEYEVSGCY